MSMQTDPLKKPERLPLTVTLSPEHFAFVQECGLSQEIDSIDSFFEMAIDVLRVHVDALLMYIEAEEKKGRSPDETFSDMTCDIKFRAAKEPLALVSRAADACSRRRSPR